MEELVRQFFLDRDEAKLRAGLTALGVPDVDGLVLQITSSSLEQLFPEGEFTSFRDQAGDEFNRPLGETAVESARDAQLGFEAGGISPDQEQARSAILRQQDPSDVFLRAGQEAFPGSVNTTLGNRVLPRLARNFQNVDPIQNFFNTDPSNANLGQRFQDFATGPRVTGEALASQLRNIIGTGTSEAISGAFTNQASGATAFQAVRPAFDAAVAPFLQTLGTSQRANAQRGLERRFRAEVAANPQSFSTPQQVFQRFSNLLPEDPQRFRAR